MAEQTYTFGPFQLCPERGLLLEGSTPVHVGTRALEILIALVERPGEVISNQELIARVWPETFVEDNNLRVHLGLLRKALRDGQDQIRYILNVPGRGYRFAAPVECRRTIAGKGRSNLPALLTHLVGRTEVVHDVIEELRGRRFVTLAGSGGIGKTSVALSVAHEVSAQYKHGVCFLDLSQVKDQKLIAEALSVALEVSPLSQDHISALIDFLSDKQMLIVLDTCEHVIEEAALLVEALLKGAQGVHFLATSREPLRAEGEWLKRLPPLETPPAGNRRITASEALAFPAVQLFVERADAILESFELSDFDAPLVGAICQGLDGVPLAIELGVARVDTIGVAGLAAQLDDCLSILTQGRRTAQCRHRTLRGNFDWSFELLPEPERILLARLGSFRTIFSLDEVLATACDEVLGVSTVIDGLTNLVAKSLVVVSFVAGRVSYRLLETMRAYALEKLGEDPADSAVRRRHAEYFRDSVKLLVHRGGSETGEVYACRRLAEEIGAALQWCSSSSCDDVLALELAVASSFVGNQVAVLDALVSQGEWGLERVDVGSKAHIPISQFHKLRNSSRKDLRLRVCEQPLINAAAGVTKGGRFPLSSG
jgi:predicted ATPase/DNA-binding winged helix-turn-helix (wHTH) protein